MKEALADLLLTLRGLIKYLRRGPPSLLADHQNAEAISIRRESEFDRTTGRGSACFGRTAGPFIRFLGQNSLSVGFRRCSGGRELTIGRGFVRPGPFCPLFRTKVDWCGF
jgi:hypothetical protein